MDRKPERIRKLGLPSDYPFAHLDSKMKRVCDFTKPDMSHISAFRDGAVIRLYGCRNAVRAEIPISVTLFWIPFEEQQAQAKSPARK